MLQIFYGQGDFKYVSQIEIKYPTVTKEDISFNLGEIVENPVDDNSYISFKTDANNVPKIRSVFF